MIALLQRVLFAEVKVDQLIIGKIATGLLVFLGIEKEDSETQADRLLTKILNYRLFADSYDKMNLSLIETKGGLMLIPQFTLAADTQKGLRPSFTPNADPEKGKILFQYMVDKAGQQFHFVQAGVFGAYMQVSLCNDGPVTFWLRVT